MQTKNEALRTIKQSGGDSEAIRLLLREGWEPEDVLMNMEERKGLRGEEGYTDITRQKAGYIGPGGEIFPLREGRVHTPQTGAEYGATYRYWPPFSEGESGTLAVNFRGVPSRTIIDAVRELVSDTGADLNWEITQNNRTTHYGMNLRGLMRDLARLRGEEEGFADISRTGNKDKFIEIADLQRGDPENAMLRLQHKAGGGVFGYIAEHVGDISHRMNEPVTFDTAGYEFVKPKVERALRVLKSGYGFLKEHRENMESNARFHSRDPVAYKMDVNRAAQKYADAHRSLPAYTEAQIAARDAAVALGEFRVRDAVKNLEKLSEHLSSPSEWKKYAHGGEEGFADISKKDQKGFDFTPVDVPGQQKGQAAEDLFQQILNAKDSSVSKRELLGINKKKKTSKEPPKDSLFAPRTMFKD